MPGRRATVDDRLVRLYLGSHRRWRRALSAADALFFAVWLGLLDPHALAGVDERFYHQRRERLGTGTATYADDAWNASGLSAWEAAVIDEHFPPSGRVLVTGAGGGREVLALLERGYDAVGWEPNERLVAAGSDFLARQGHPGRLHISAREGFPPGAGRADGVAAGWASYMLMAGSTRRVAWLRGARAALEPGAPVLLSFFLRQEDGPGGDRTVRIANAVRRLRRSEPVEVGDTLNPFYAHRFVRDEIAAELRQGGFEMVHYQREPYGHAVGRAV